jgi:hypothetical protein
MTPRMLPCPICGDFPEIRAICAACGGTGQIPVSVETYYEITEGERKTEKQHERDNAMPADTPQRSSRLYR